MEKLAPIPEALSLHFLPPHFTEMWLSLGFSASVSRLVLVFSQQYLYLHGTHISSDFHGSLFILPIYCLILGVLDALPSTRSPSFFYTGSLL